MFKVLLQEVRGADLDSCSAATGDRPRRGDVSVRKRLSWSKILAVTVAIVVSVSGCAISTIPKDGANGKTVLTFWEYFQGTQLTWLQDRVKSFEKRHSNVDIELVEVTGDQQDQKLLGSVATGKTPDLFINNIVVDYPRLVNGGVMKDLTPYWKKYSDKDQFPPNATWETDGHIYNLMSYNNLIGMYYNKEALKASGISKPPTTLEELQIDLAKIKQAGKYKGIAFSGDSTVEGAWLFAPQLLGLGVDYCNFRGAKVHDAFQRIANWRKHGYVPRSSATWDQTDAWQKFMTGKYAFALNGNWNLGNAQENADFDYGTAQYPAPAGGKSKVFPGGEGFAIGSKARHPDIAWQFLKEEIMSKQGGKTVYEAAGSVPLRKDLLNWSKIKNDAKVQPFARATRTTASWPDNPNTADMQNSLGAAVSGVLSGQQSADDAANQAVRSISDLIKKGGGEC